MNSSRRELYVYYRVAPSSWRAAVAAVRAQQRRLCSEHPGLIARLLRRPGEDAGSVTLMEVYTLDNSPGSIDAALEAQIAEGASVLKPWQIGERHVEAFDSLD